LADAVRLRFPGDGGGRAMTSAPPRVLMFSQRNIYEIEVWRSGLREFEELIRAIDGVDLLAPRPGRWVAQRKRLALRVGRDSSIVLNAGIPKIKPARRYDLFFAICEKPGELLNVNSLEGFNDWCTTSVCWLNELWVKEMPSHKSSLKVLSKFDYVFSPLSQSVDAINEAIGPKCFYMPQSVDAAAFLPYPKAPARTIDVLSVGRRSDQAHDALLRMAKDDAIFYVYNTQKYLHTDNIEEHRFLMTSLCKRSRYFVAYPAKWDRPDERGDQSEIGSRYFEGAAAGTIMIGARPRNAEFDTVFSWPDAVVSLPADPAAIPQVLHDLDRDPERQQRIRRTNIVQSLLQHDWVYRWESILTAAGLSPMPELLKRKQRLAHLAEMVQTGAISV
jgi:hypothetical protein